MTYLELLVESQDANQYPDRVELIASLVADYVIEHHMDFKEFDFKKYFLALEMD